MTEKETLKFAKIIIKNLKKSNESNIIFSILKICNFIPYNYCEIVNFKDEGYKISSKPDNSYNEYGTSHFMARLKDKDFKEKYFIFEETKKDRKVFCEIFKILFNNEHIGYLLIESDQKIEEYGKELIGFYLDFVNSSGVEINTRRILDMEIKKERQEIMKLRSIQVSLLPNFKNIPNYDISMTFLPMEEISGDFIDGIYLTPDLYQLTICDVSGHGISSSFIGTSIRSFIRTISKPGLGPAECMDLLNSILIKELFDIKYYASIIICQMDLNTNEVKITSAGHPPFLYYNKKKNSLKKIYNTGSVIGFFHEEKYREISIVLEDGDTVFMYTDGLTESYDENLLKMYGEKKLEKVFIENIDSDSLSIIHSVLSDLYEYINYSAITDDLSIVCIKKKGSSHSENS